MIDMKQLILKGNVVKSLSYIGVQNVLQRRRALEQRIMIFWFPFLEKLYSIFVFYHAILLRSGLK